MSGGSSSTPMGTPQQRGQIRQPPPSATLLSQVPSVEFATKEEAEKAFVKLLRETASSTWMDIGKWDHLYISVYRVYDLIGRGNKRCERLSLIQCIVHYVQQQKERQLFIITLTRKPNVNV